MKKELRLMASLTVTVLLLTGGCQNKIEKTHSAKTSCDISFEHIPFEMDNISPPEIPDRLVDIRDFGAIGDGITDNSDAINTAIKNLSEKGGGKVVIPAGIWITGPVYLADNINLHAEANALIIFSPDYRKYPIISTSFEGLNTFRSTSPIMAKGLKNIAITGEGVFDGSGEAWRHVKKSKMTDSQWKKLISSGGVLNETQDIWYPSEMSLKGSMASALYNNPQGMESKEAWESVHQWLRPVMVSIVECKNVLLEGVTFRNTPCWGLHPLMSEDIIIKNVKVFNPWYSQNGDGLDVESCNRVIVMDCLFDVGDDGICIKSGKDEAGRQRGIPCSNLIIYNNTVLHGHGGFVVGSEMSGGVNNIYVKNCTFIGTDVGLRFKSNRGRGGVVENITIENIYMSDIVTETLLFDLYYNGKSAVETLEEGGKGGSNGVAFEVTEETPQFKDITIKDVYCKGARRAMFFNGLPEMKINNIYVSDVVITSEIGAELVNTENVTIENTRIIPTSGEAFTVRQSSGVKINGEVIN